MNTKIYIFLLLAVFTVISISNVIADPSADPSSAALLRSKRDLLSGLISILNSFGKSLGSLIARLLNLLGL
ncbi:hypothetical protein CAJAP_04564 [Camponotus japonicus]